MNIAMSGSTGFIGSYLKKTLAAKGLGIIPLARSDFSAKTSLQDKIEQADAVINLAGAPIAARWTETYKKELYDSRVPITEKIVAAICGLEQKPKAFISACGVGIYPNGGTYTENDTAYADDFLGQLAQKWEQAALQAQQCDIRTIVFRFGVVLGPGGGALAKMLPLFRLGLGGKIGTGNQAFSWVHIHDLARAHSTALENGSYSGVYNLTAPNPTTNKGLTKALAQAVHRPALFPVPGLFVKLLFGEGAVVLLDGQNVLPRRLLDAGFQFDFQHIDDALQDIITYS